MTGKGTIPVPEKTVKTVSAAAGKLKIVQQQTAINVPQIADFVCRPRVAEALAKADGCKINIPRIWK